MRAENRFTGRDNVGGSGCCVVVATREGERNAQFEGGVGGVALGPEGGRQLDHAMVGKQRLVAVEGVGPLCS